MTDTSLTPPARTGPIDLAARAPAPDLARGAVLLLIAVANAHLFLFGHGVGVRGYPPDPAPGERALALVQVLLVDGRAYPMFGALFGYGLVRLARRTAGPAGRRDGDVAGAALLRRRSRWLLVIGFAHGTLLFSGDIVGAYGLLGLLLGSWVVTAPDRRLLRAAGLWLLGPAVAGALLAAPVPPGQSAWMLSMTVSEPLPALAVRVAEWVVVGLVQALGVAAAVMVGAWAARRRLLDDPARHRPILRRIASVGLVTAVMGAVPLALMCATLWADPSVPARLAAGVLHAVTGYGGGFAYAALAGLAAARWAGRPGAVTTAIIACGRRSLTCYLAQSVVLVAVLAPYGGGRGDRVGLAGSTGIAIATWVVTVIGADLLRRNGRRGPAETWLRRRTYPRTRPQ